MRTVRWFVELDWRVWGLGVAVGRIEGCLGFGLSLGPLELAVKFSTNAPRPGEEAR